MTDRDTTTRTRARAPGVGGVFHRMAVHDRVLRPDSERTTVATTKCTKGGCKLDGGRRMPGAGLSRQSPRKAPLGQSAFQPYWGKLAVRNDRGDRGNVGIIRSPIRASILPDRNGPRSRADGFGNSGVGLCDEESAFCWELTSVGSGCVSCRQAKSSPRLRGPSSAAKRVRPRPSGHRSEALH